MDPLSGGMKRRLTIARSLIADPEILILDEPTTGLDPQARHLLWDRLYRLKQQGVTQIITTHYMDEAEQLCDRLAVMDNGTFAAEGSPSELIARYSTREVLELRFRDPDTDTEAMAARLSGSVARFEALPDRLLLYSRRRRGHPGRGAPARPRSRQRPRAALDTRRRLPPPDRPVPGRLTDGVAMTTTSAPTAPGRPRPTARRRPSPTWVRSMGYWMYQYKRTWRGSITTSFLYPVLYLSAMGLGLGSLITHPVDGVRYLDFLAPGLLASTAMQIGGNEAMYPVMAAIKWLRTYFAMLATPLTVIDVLVGHLAWIALRLFMVTSIYLAIMAAFGTVHSALAILAVPVGILTGLAFAAPIAGFAAAQQNDMGFSAIYRFGLIPLFLFSGTFFPITQLPGWLQPVAEATPLYHGVALCRALTLGHVGLAAAGAHLAYLVVLTAVGFVVAQRTYRRRLVT